MGIAASQNFLEFAENLPVDLPEKYVTSGPRYTSYPTAPVWQPDFDAAAFEVAIRQTNMPMDKTVGRPTGSNPLPLSLYTHLPFCESRCLFCGCNVVITQQHEQAEKYLDYLFRELERTAGLMDTSRPVAQLHWGGGTPTYLSPEQMERLFHFQKDHFNLAPDAEIAIEVDPRVTTPEQIDLLKTLGFNRISLGVQDFDATVQKAIHRIQPYEQTASMVNQCRSLGFEGLNFDLIYGLPHQTVETFQKTLDQVLTLSPDRIALYHFAYVPWLSPHQKAIPEASLPGSEEKFGIFRLALQTLTRAGYLYIGMDHFAKPTDELAVALENGTLHRNFMGYTTKAGCELYGFGVSAISGLERYYAQNVKKLSEYYEAVTENRLPTQRGYALSDDDVIRRRMINNILCNSAVSYNALDTEFSRFDLNSRNYFASERVGLPDFESDGLLTLNPDGFTLTPLGRILSRNIAMPFDAYLKKQTDTKSETGVDKPIFSKTL